MAGFLLDARLNAFGKTPIKHGTGSEIRGAGALAFASGTSFDL